MRLTNEIKKELEKDTWMMFALQNGISPDIYKSRIADGWLKEMASTKCPTNGQHAGRERSKCAICSNH